MSTTRVTDNAVIVRGLAPLQRAFRKTEGDLAPDLRKRLTELAKPVRDKAQANIQHKTGRHSKDGPLRVKIGVAQRGVSVYSNEPYARIQDQGGRVGHGAVITRASASQYMTKAVREARADTEAALQQIGQDIENEYGRN